MIKKLITRICWRNQQRLGTTMIKTQAHMLFNYALKTSRHQYGTLPRGRRAARRRVRGPTAGRDCARGGREHDVASERGGCLAGAVHRPWRLRGGRFRATLLTPARQYFRDYQLSARARGRDLETRRRPRLMCGCSGTGISLRHWVVSAALGGCFCYAGERRKGQGHVFQRLARRCARRWWSKGALRAWWEHSNSEC